MAKKKIEDSEIQDSGDIFDAFKVLDEMNPDAAFLDENALSNVNEWVDTGNMALNANISGSLNGGIPMGRLTGFVGPESTGKTLMINKIIANAQKKGMYAVYFDTEGALDRSTAERLGCDVSRIKHCPIEIIEDCRNQIVKFLANIVEKKLQGKVIIAIDSLGNLLSKQEKNKIEDGSDAPDFGNRAKACLCPDTLIHTETGVKKISDVKIGEKVITHLGRFREIKDKWTVNHKKYIILKTKKSDIKLSLNHRLLVKRNDKLKFIEAKNIKKTDKLIKIIEQDS